MCVVCLDRVKPNIRRIHQRVCTVWYIIYIYILHLQWPHAHTYTYAYIHIYICNEISLFKLYNKIDIGF